MAQSITLTASMRSNLMSLQSTAAMMGVTQERLATGRRVNSAIDDPSAYFSAKQGFEQSDALTAVKSSLNEGLQTIKAATTALDAVDSILTQMKSLVNQSNSTSDDTTRSDLATQFNTLQTQLSDLLKNDAEYKGTNLLNGNNLSLSLNADGSSSIQITGTDTSDTSSDYVVSTVDGTTITAAGSNVDTAINAYRSLAKTLGSSSAYVQTRIDFAQSMSNIFKTGAENLVAADTNEEGANMLMLNTRQQLATTALSLSAQATQSVLRLF